jgi:hypothetical protein
MTAVPTVHSWTNNEQPNFRDMKNYVEDPWDFIMNPPMVRLRKTTAQTLTNTVTASIIWDFIEVENYNFWDSTVPTRLTPSVPGWYVGQVGFGFVANATGLREMNVVKNGSGTERVLRVNHIAYPTPLITVNRGNVFLESFNGTTDYIEVQVFQNSGGNLALLSDVTEHQPDITLRWFAAL